jgi:hypothetical protein
MLQPPMQNTGVYPTTFGKIKGCGKHQEMFRNITAAVWREHLAFVRERPVVRAETVNTLKVIIIPVDESAMHACMHPKPDSINRQASSQRRRTRCTSSRANTRLSAEKSSLLILFYSGSRTLKRDLRVERLAGKDDLDSSCW